MNTVEVYETSDGNFHRTEQDALNAQFDILGKALDGFLSDDPKGHFEREVRQRVLIATMSDPDVLNKICALYAIARYMLDQDCLNPTPKKTDRP